MLNKVLRWNIEEVSVYTAEPVREEGMRVFFTKSIAPVKFPSKGSKAHPFVFVYLTESPSSHKICSYLSLLNLLRVAKPRFWSATAFDFARAGSIFIE